MTNLTKKQAVDFLNDNGFDAYISEDWCDVNGIIERLIVNEGGRSFNVSVEADDVDSLVEAVKSEISRIKGVSDNKASWVEPEF